MLGLFSALGATVLRAMSLMRSDRKLAGAAAALSILTFVIVTITFLLLTYYFLTSDFTYMYVWSYSSSDLSTIYKLSGVWAGAEGSFLLWTWLMTIVLAIEVVLEPRRKYLSARFHGVFQISMAGLVFIFLVILLAMDLFEETSSFLLQMMPDGYGLNLSLQTPEMVVHPPIVFAGYAFCAAVLAASFAYFMSDDRNWFMITLPWGRLAWMLLTLGIGIGAIWAYYVLGWGGYWAWDPVETSSLVPWLVMTAFLHTQVRHVRKDEYATLSPTLGMFSFVAVLFATFATRAGSIWEHSVHSFPGGEGDTASGRLGYLLQNDAAVLGVFSLMLVLLAVSMYLAYTKSRSTPPSEEQPEPERVSEYISDRNNMILTVLLLLVTTAVMMLILFKNIDVTQSANYDEFNQKMSIFFVALMVVMTICLAWKFLGKEMMLTLSIIIIAASVVLGAVAIVYDFVPALVAFSLPSYLVAVGISVLKIAKSRVPGSVRKTLQKVGPQIIHLGIALVLVSYIVSSNMQTYPPGGSSSANGLTVDVGSSLAAGDYDVTLVSLDLQMGEDNTVVTLATVDIQRNGKSVAEDVVLSDTYGYSAQDDSLMVLEAEVYIYKSIMDDLYMSFQWKDNASAFIDMKVLPLMNFLWGGLILLAVGLAIRVFAWQQEPKVVAKQGRPPEPLGKPQQKEPAKDYSALVEEELKKYKQKKSGTG